MIKLKSLLKEAKVKTPTEIVTSVSSSSIPDQHIPRADVMLGLHMGDKLGRGLTLTNKDYSLGYSEGKVALKLTSNGRMAVRVRTEKIPDYVDQIKKVADAYLMDYAKNIKKLNEVSDLKNYPADVQKQYNDLLKNFGQAFADRYLERYDEENEPSEPGLKQQIYDKLKLAKQNTAKEIKQKKFGSDKYPTVLLKHFGIELRKLGKITDAQLNQLINKEGIKTIWQETEFVFKLFNKQKK